MLNFLLDPSVSLALSFCCFFLFLGKKIGLVLKDMILEYVQTIKSQRQKAQDLLEQATKAFEEAQLACDNQEKHQKEILDLARLEVSNLKKKTEILCQNIEKSKAYLFQQQCAFLMEKHQREYGERVLADLQKEVLRQLESHPHVGDISFSFLNRNLTRIPESPLWHKAEA